MSLLGRTVPLKAVVGAAVALVLAALLPALSSTPEREVTLIVRGMAFYLDGEPATANPTIEVRAGERVRIVVRNQDRGLTHDFAVPALGAAVNPLRWNESGGVTFDAPPQPGTYEYVCQPHRVMMRGLIRVR